MAISPSFGSQLGGGHGTPKVEFRTAIVQIMLGAHMMVCIWLGTLSSSLGRWFLKFQFITSFWIFGPPVAIRHLFPAVVFGKDGPPYQVELIKQIASKLLSWKATNKKLPYDSFSFF